MRINCSSLQKVVAFTISNITMKRRATGKKTKPKPPSLKKLDRIFFDQPSLQLSEALLGKVLARKLPSGEVLRGTIVETEAYPGDTDQASSTFNGRRTERNAALYMDPGTAYVYFTYGMYHCFNISAQGEGAAVLIRALEPLEDCAVMHELRNRSRKKKKMDDTKTGDGEPSQGPNDQKPKKPYKMYELANGPGKLCLAFDIAKVTCDKLDLCTSDQMWLEHHDEPKFHPGNFVVELAKRVGIDSTPKEARNQLWRFLIEDNFAVSTAKPSQIKKKLESQEATEPE